MNKKVLVLGAGVAGLQAAVSLKELGYKVIVVEKSSDTGGHVKGWDKLYPGNLPSGELIKGYRSGIEGIELLCDTTISGVSRSERGFISETSSGASIDSSAVIIATGFSLFDASRKEEYGYGLYQRVITNSDMESLFLSGNIHKMEIPHKVGFVHCVGSRDEKVCNRHCSKICCMTAVKQACEIKEIWPQTDVYCFYMDLRMFGRGYEDLYYEAQSKYGVNFIRGRVSEAGENQNGKIVIKAEDTLTSRPLKITLDLLVLMAGMVRNPDNKTLAEIYGVSLGEDGFFKQPQSIINPTSSDSPRIFFAGSATGPKTVAESVNEAKAAAYSVHMMLSKE